MDVCSECNHAPHAGRPCPHASGWPAIPCECGIGNPIREANRALGRLVSKLGEDVEEIACDLTDGKIGPEAAAGLLHDLAAVLGKTGREYQR